MLTTTTRTTHKTEIEQRQNIRHTHTHTHKGISNHTLAVSQPAAKIHGLFIITI